MFCFDRYSVVYGVAAIATLMLCACTASGNSSSSDGSGGAGGDTQSTGSGSSVHINNLNITLAKMEGESRLTFALENTASKNLQKCSSGTITTSTGNKAIVTFGSGGCNGIVGPNASVPEDYCADAALESLCNDGLPAGATSGILAVYGATSGLALDPWEEPGTTYTLELRFLMADAELVSPKAVTTMK